jgi:hypothetical protein
MAMITGKGTILHRRKVRNENIERITPALLNLLAGQTEAESKSSAVLAIIAVGYLSASPNLTFYAPKTIVSAGWWS